MSNSDKNLPPLHEVDEDLNKGNSFTTELSFKSCKHVLEALSSTEAHCIKCGVGWTGPNIEQLVNASRSY